ncbi:MAG: ABC transporter substrate-binding protein, partial [Clostridium sp.]
MKKIIISISFILIFTLCLIGCSKKTNANIVNIGWIGSLTGDQAVWGDSEYKALNMYFDKINAEGGVLGKQINLIGYDTRGEGAESVSAARRLIGKDRVVAIIGPNSSGQAISISGVLEETHTPSISTAATNPKVTVIDGTVKPYNFRVCFIDPYQGDVAASYSYNKLGAKKAAVLYDVGDDYSQGLTDYFSKTFKSLGGEIVAYEGFKTGDVDFRAQLTKIKKSNPDIIFMPLYFKEAALAAKQSREIGITSTLIGGDGWPSDQLLAIAGDTINGSYFVNHLDYNDPEVLTYRKNYKNLYSKESELNGYLAY